MTIPEYIECVNKAFEAKYKNKGFFLATEQFEKTPFPILKKLNVKIIHYPSKDTVFNFIFQDKVPTGKEELFKQDCLKELITTVIYEIHKIWEYGNKDK